MSKIILNGEYIDLDLITSIDETVYYLIESQDYYKLKPFDEDEICFAVSFLIQYNARELWIEHKIYFDDNVEYMNYKTECETLANKFKQMHKELVELWTQNQPRVRSFNFNKI